MMVSIINLFRELINVVFVEDPRQYLQRRLFLNVWSWSAKIRDSPHIGYELLRNPMAYRYLLLLHSFPSFPFCLCVALLYSLHL